MASHDKRRFVLPRQTEPPSALSLFWLMHSHLLVGLCPSNTFIDEIIPKAVSEPHYGAYTDPAPLDLDIDNSTSFTGGKDPQPYTLVQQSDIDNAANYLETINQKNAIANINSQLQSGEHLVKDPQCNSDIIPDHAAGDHTDTVNVRVATTCEATAST